jgi:hypothetical protein
MLYLIEQCIHPCVLILLTALVPVVPTNRDPHILIPPTVLLDETKTTFSPGCTHQPGLKVRWFPAPLRSHLFSSRAFHRFPPPSSHHFSLYICRHGLHLQITSRLISANLITLSHGFHRISNPWEAKALCASNYPCPLGYRVPIGWMLSVGDVPVPPVPLGAENCKYHKKSFTK